MEKSLDSAQKARWIGLIVLVGMTIAVAMRYVDGFYFNHGYPISTFLFRPDSHWSDFYLIMHSIKAGNPYGHPVSVYFPFTYIPLQFLRPFSVGVGLIIFSIGFAVTATAWMWSQLRALPSRLERLHVSLLLALCTYPTLFLLDRANFEALVFACLVGFLWALRRDKIGWSVFFIAAATAMKAYPAVFGIFYLMRRQYRAAVTAPVLVVFMTYFAGGCFPGGFRGSWSHLKTYLEMFNNFFVTGNGGLGYNSSYYNVLRLLAELKVIEVPLDVLRARYFFVCLAIFAALALYVAFKETVFWKQVTLLVLSVILLPHVSFDYKLVHLLIPVGLFISSKDDTRNRRGFTYFYALILGLLLVPRAYCALLPNNPEAAWAPVENCALMTLLAVTIVVEGLFFRRTPPPTAPALSEATA